MKFLIASLFTVSCFGQADYNNQLKNQPQYVDISRGNVGISTACSAATTANRSLLITATWDYNGTLACGISAYGKLGVLKPTTGHTITLTGNVDFDSNKHIDLSGGGTVIISNANIPMRPEWFGAKADNSTDNKAAIDYLIGVTNGVDAAKTVQLSAGIYKYIGKLTALAGKHGIHFKGMGNSATILYFSDSTQTAGIEISGSSTSFDLSFEDMQIKGPGIAAGTMYGFYSHGGVGNNKLLRRNVVVSDFSLDCWHSQDWFMTRTDDSWDQNCGGSGYYVDGDQAPILIGSGHFSNNLGGYCIDVRVGASIITGYNCGSPLGGGAHFGGSGGATFAHPNIQGLNIEAVTTIGGHCLYFEAGSSFSQIVGVPGLQCHASGVAAGTPIHWENLGQSGIIEGAPAFYTDSGGTWITPYYDATSYIAGHTILALGFDPTSLGSASFNAVTVPISSCTDSFAGIIPTCINKPIKVAGVINTATARVKTGTITTSAYAFHYTETKEVYLANPTTNTANLVITLDNASLFAPGAKFTFKKVDATSTYYVQLNPAGVNIDGSTGGYFLLKPNQWVEIMSDGTAWWVIAAGIGYGNGNTTTCTAWLYGFCTTL